jgi:hypothetical protein
VSKNTNCGKNRSAHGEGLNIRVEKRVRRNFVELCCVEGVNALICRGTLGTGVFSVI